MGGIFYRKRDQFIKTIQVLLTILVILFSSLILTPKSTALTQWKTTTDKEFLDGEFFNLTIFGNNSDSFLSINTYNWVQKSP